MQIYSGHSFATCQIISCQRFHLRRNTVIWTFPRWTKVSFGHCRAREYFNFSIILAIYIAVAVVVERCRCCIVTTQSGYFWKIYALTKNCFQVSGPTCSSLKKSHCLSRYCHQRVGFYNIDCRLFYRVLICVICLDRTATSSCNS